MEKLFSQNIVVNNVENSKDTSSSICVARHAHNDWLKVSIPFEAACNFHWDFFGPDNTWHKEAHIYCSISFKLACNLGLIRCPRRAYSNYDVKVCVIQKYTDKKLLKEIKDIVGTKPKPISSI